MHDKRNEVAYQANKLRNGLTKLVETRETVEALAVELEEATVQGCMIELISLLNIKNIFLGYYLTIV